MNILKWAHKWTRFLQFHPFRWNVMAAHFFYSRNTLVRISKWKVQISITTKSHMSEITSFFRRLDIFYIMFKGNIVNIVPYSHLYNSFLLIIVACIVILLVAILYRDHVGFCVIVTFSSIQKLKWPVLLSYLREWNQTGTELTHIWHTKCCLFILACVDVCWIHVYRFNIILKSFFVIQLHIRTI
jgi:hypothetical protein